MKVMLFVSASRDADQLSQVLVSSGHVVAATVLDPQSLTYLTAQHAPHALVVESCHYDVSSSALAVYQSIYPNVQIYPCDLEQVEWDSKLCDFVGRPAPQAKPRPYASGARVVYHDPHLLQLSSGKLHRPRYDTPDWQSACTQQEARFVLQLQTGRENHAAAMHYYRCLQAQQPGIQREIAYRLAHSSYKGLSWSRDLAAQWLGLICHYVPGVELEYLPPPMTVGPAVDFVRHEMSQEGLYGLTLLLMFGVSPAIAEEIKYSGTARFEQQSDIELLQLSLRLYGFARLLQVVGTAQVRLMSAWLDPARSDAGKGLRGYERSLGVLRDFFDMNYVLHAPHPLRDILLGHHRGTTYVPHPPRIPKFQEWRRILQTQES